MTPLVDPALASPETVLGALDFAGVAVFAATGALAAARAKHDLVTFAFFAAITGVGGGALRDLLIAAPVFRVQDWRSWLWRPGSRSGQGRCSGAGVCRVFRAVRPAAEVVSS